jgi:H+-transporting ATPase
MIMDVDGFAGVYPSRLHGLRHLSTMSSDSANDTLALSRADVGVQGATDTARGAADMVLTESDLVGV